MKKNIKITWTKVDEAPALASYSLLPIVKAFVKAAGVEVEESDISLAGRIIANFPDHLNEDQKRPDDLAKLGKLVMEPDANIIKLPNISASIPQLKEAIKELNEKGYNIPDYPEEPKTEEEKALVERFSKVLGSAVNPVLRQGNSDRRAANSVKKFAQKHPHKLMKPFNSDSKTHVSFMSKGDFYGNEQSITTDQDLPFKIILESDKETVVLKDGLSAEKGETLDGTFMSAKALRDFYDEQIKDAKEKEVLFSLHLKATMMKVSDPILFGHAVKVFYKDLFDKHGEELERIGFNPNNGIDDLYKKLDQLTEDEKSAILQTLKEIYASNPDLAMVDSDKGITNLHAPNLVIVDASMPVVVRDGGKMWGPDGQLHETKAVIPDRSYSRMYQAIIEDCKINGQFDPATMGSVSNVGLMAKKAEEYGSHPTTFEIPFDGKVKVVDDKGSVLMEHDVEKGDIWRMSRVKDIAVKDWVKLAVNRAKATNDPAIFWLDKNRAHDAQLIEKVERYLKDHDTEGLEIHIMDPVEAMNFTTQRVREGKNVISVTGNVLRDYLTDLFPILELGTSARMLSIVPLLAGGGLFETGAGGSAPKHVQQFLKEGHLRWDSLGEFLALMVSLEFIASKYDNKKASVLSKTLDQAIEKYLENQKSPSRKAGEPDNRASHFYLAQYWADALAKQKEDTELSSLFAQAANELKEKEETILEEIMKTEGKPTDIGGYYLPDDAKASQAMRPSKTLNQIIASL